VRLRALARCPGPIVRLGDVAELSGADAAPGAVPLAQIPLCPTPPAGSPRTLSLAQVRELLATSGCDLAGIVLSGSSEVVVESATGQATSPPAARGMAARHDRAVQRAVYIENQPAAAVTPLAGPAAPQPAVSAAGPSPASKTAALPRLVERGAIVTVHARRPGVEITAPGKTLGPAALGETVSVELEETRQRLLARVVGPQDVEVVAAAPSRPQ
jgi:hypothetical protein